MKTSPLYKYYSKHEPLMLERIRKDKSAKGYKVTSRRMFEAEVNIMTDVIVNLNAKGIQVLYVYDALVCEEKDKPVVIGAMTRIILEHGVKTSVKATEPHNPELLPIETIKNKLRNMINHELYQGKESDIRTMLTAFDHTTVEEFSGFYNHILQSVSKA